MNWIAEVKSKLNIVDFMRSDGIDLRNDGIDRYSSRCPFHNEKTPSFKVSETYQNYKCFGCGESGDVISFFGKRNVLDYYTAASMLAEKLGIKISKIDNEETNKRKRFFKILADLELFYKDKFNFLEENHPAKKEILERGLNISNDFGYSPSNISETMAFFEEKKYLQDDLKELGLLTENNLPLFRDRLMFFIRNYMGQTIGFSGRILTKGETSYKYVNSKSSLIFDKQTSLYNIDEAKNFSKERGFMYIVEGQFDVIAMKQKGYENTVAISGSALTLGHSKEIMRTLPQNGKIILLLDGDEAGEKAMKKAFMNLPILHKNLEIITLPNNLDPCDFLKTNSQLPNSINMLSYIFNTIKNEKPLTLTENRADFLDRIQLEFTQYIKDPILKEQYLRNACILVGLNYNNLNILSFKESKKTLLSTDVSNNNLKANMTEEDKYYLASISCFISNKEFLNNQLYPKFYPEKYLNIINEINSKINLPFIPENYSNPKIIEIISDIGIEKFIDKELAVNQYKMLISQAKKIQENKSLEEKMILLANNSENLNPNEILNLLKSLEEVK